MKYFIKLVRMPATGGSPIHTSETVPSDSESTAKEIAINRVKQRYPKDDVMIEDVKQVK
ncbi:MAG: hypothetical protein LBT40_00430 [Deltaproteobacteria bacterium]|jgi:hypothetical protein|nr:hypothetical protein [Deltaproteobacteria bacterium]